MLKEESEGGNDSLSPNLLDRLVTPITHMLPNGDVAYSSGWDVFVRGSSVKEGGNLTSQLQRRCLRG